MRPYEMRNTTVSNGRRLVFFFEAVIGVTALLANKVVKRHPRFCPATAGVLEIAAYAPSMRVSGRY
jgi:hypothetical protein